MTHSVEILKTEPVTHDVRRIVVAKPDGYAFTPGHATGVAVDRDGWRDEQRPFTSRNERAELEFTIKV